MPQIARIHNDTIVDNLTAHAADVSDELNSLVNESNSQDTRLTTIEGGSLTSGYVLVTDKNNFLYHAANITGSSTGSAVFTTATNHGITNGDIIKYGLGSDGVIDVGLSQAARYYGRSLTLTTFSFHNTYADAIAGNNAVITTSQGSGTRYLIAGPKSPYREGDLFIDGLGAHYVLGGNLMDILSVNNFDLRTIRSLAAPLYVSATTFTMSRISERDSGNKLSILKSTSTTVDISTTGLNGIAQSGNLTGTVSVTTGSTSVTFSSSQTGTLQAGDVLTTNGGQARKLVSVSGNTAVVESQFVSTETNVAFKRGGRCSFYSPNTSGVTGTCIYFLYAITDGTTPGLILSTRCVAKGDTLVDLPNGYIYSKIIPWWETLYADVTAAGVYQGISAPKYCAEGWPYRPEIIYNFGFTNELAVYGQTNVLPAGTNNTWTSLSLSAWVPIISRVVTLLAAGFNGPSYNVRPTGSTNNGIRQAIFNGNSCGVPLKIATDANQSIDWIHSAGTGASVALDVFSCVVTELA